MKKKFWHIFSRIIGCDKPQRTIYKGPQGIVTITVEIVRPNLWDLRGCLKHKIFEKKRKLSSEEESLTCYFWYCRTRKTSRNDLWGSARHSDIYCESYKISSLGPKKLLKTENFEKKRQSFLWRKGFGLLFLKLSSATNLTQRFIIVDKVPWHLLWKLLDHFCDT